MQFSVTLKSSAHSLPSPDGRHIATLLSNVINVRAVHGLDVVNVIQLAQDPSTGPVLSFQWSPSSRLLLVADAERVQVVSALDDSVNAVIRNYVGPGTKLAYVGFGASDTEVCVISSLGLRFAIFDLASSRAVEIGSPKIFSPSSASRCFSFRPETHHLALLTRAAGKDMVSIHGFPEREVQRSWAPDTVDAQGLTWSPDGRWLAVWDSAAQGHKVVLYTSDGHVFKTWSGPANPAPEDRDYALGAGVKSIQFSADARYLAIGDFSRSVCILSMASVTETMRLQHPRALIPKETLQVWQEQISPSETGPVIHTFLRAMQPISPSPRPRDDPELMSGCASISFDSSSALVATLLDAFPGTIWIWDLQVAELRAVLLFHGNVSDLSWHPHVPETLLARCEGDQYTGLVFAWDPLSGGPRSVDFRQHLPGAKAGTKPRALWLGLDASNPPSIFISDAQNYVLACIGEVDQGLPPWGGQRSSERGVSRERREESPLDLIPASGTGPETLQIEEDDDYSELEDTFVHKR
ncbi:hypothetical protein VTK56DRAFT_6837 [Thermocarpiscus australiensis]